MRSSYRWVLILLYRTYIYRSSYRWVLILLYRTYIYRSSYRWVLILLYRTYIYVLIPLGPHTTIHVSKAG
jgi:hypothetical protein